MNKLIDYLNIDENVFKIKEIYYTDTNFPRRLLSIKNYPKKLYVIGNEKLLNNFSISIVGSRKCTKYGINVTKNIAGELSNIGITIVSGMAIGIDTIAHTYSMEKKGKTVAVLGSGFKNIYPEENKKLFIEIINKGGCIITEYDKNVTALPKNFPMRNRIISGLSVATLMVEAMRKSGSNITARYTIHQDKKLFCIPNSIEIKQSEGTNEFIRKGGILTRNYTDILEEFIPNYYIKEIKKGPTVYCRAC